MTPRGLVLQILGALLGLLGLVVSGRVFFLAWESSWRRGIDFHVYLAAARIARDIVNKIEETLEYPGQIKVMVIRETRVVDYAK